MQHNNENVNLASACPVPLEQQPIQQYRHLRESRFFRWAILKRDKYTVKLLAVGISGLLLTLLVFAAKDQYNIYKYNFWVSTVIAQLIVLVFLIRLYAAWEYIYLRLISQRIDYRILATRKTRLWDKPKLWLAQDRLIARFQVRPTLKRLKHSILHLLLFTSLNFLILFITINH